jgi:hypothetical protein
MMILIALIFRLPVIGMQMGVDLNTALYLITTPTGVILRGILRLTGNVGHDTYAVQSSTPAAKRVPGLRCGIPQPDERRLAPSHSRALEYG